MNRTRMTLLFWCFVLLDCPKAVADVDVQATQYWVRECKDFQKSKLCAGYILALVHANEFATHIMKKPLWCAQRWTILQNHAIVMKFVTDNPKLWDSPFFAVAVLALAEAYPCEK